MCGRYEQTKTSEFLRTWFRVERAAPEWAPRWNIVPGQLAPVLRVAPNGGRQLEMMRWGLLPHWAKDRRMARRCFNAQAETLTSQSAYRAAFKVRRCLVPATAYYVWSNAVAVANAAGRDTERQPFRVAPASGVPMAFAGVWEPPHPRAAPPAAPSFAIVTTPANRYLGRLGERMPAMIDAADHDTWFGGTAESALTLLRPYDDGLLAYPVDRRITQPGNDAPDLIAPVGPPLV